MRNKVRIGYTKDLLLIQSYIDGEISHDELTDKIFPYTIQDMIGLINKVEFDSSDRYNKFVKEFKLANHQ